jgi:competence protein ComEC
MLLHVGIVATALAIHSLTKVSTGLGWFFLATTGACFALLLFIHLFKRTRSGFANRARLERLLLGLVILSLFAGSTVFQAQSRLDHQLSADLEGQVLVLQGVVHGLPAQFEQTKSFDFLVQDSIPASSVVGQQVRLSWSKLVPQNLMPGQQWRLSVKVRRPYARVNPGLFDAELRMFEEGIVALGSVDVRDGQPAVFLSDQTRHLQGWRWWVQRCRHHLRVAIETATIAGSDNTPESKSLNPSQPVVKANDLRAVASGMLIALVVGDQGAIASSWWEVFNQTGVSHLMSISGLHVTMMAAAMSVLGKFVWVVLVQSMALLPGRFANAQTYVPTKTVFRWFCAIVGAWIYTAIAGFGIPAQRTCWMVTLAGLAVLQGRGGSALRVVSFTAAAVTVIDPWAVLSAGFWLSFCAVSAIIYLGSGSFNKKVHVSRWRAWWVDSFRNGWQSQVAATAALLPVGAVFFSSFALLSPVANAVAIPLVSGVITPLAIMGALLASLSELLGSPGFTYSLLSLAVMISEPLLAGLLWLSKIDGAVAILGKPAIWLWPLACIGLLLFLAPFSALSLSSRSAGALALMPIAIYPSSAPNPGDAWVTVFDVGQGGAVLVETKQRTLLFDTGPKYGAESDAGSKVLAPYLRSRGIKKLDALVISHLDVAHTGGLNSVLQSYRVGWTASSIPQSYDFWQQHEARKFNSPRKKTDFYPCLSGHAWEWDGVRFEFLHPTLEVNASRNLDANAQSCVLHIKTKGSSALIAADIAAAQEKFIVRRYENANRQHDLRAEVLIAPNHGSKTSSSELFIATVKPEYAIFQVAHLNRFKQPDPSVLARYEQHGSKVLRTDYSGAIKATLGAMPSTERVQIEQTRRAWSPYWRVQFEGRN